MTVQDESSDRVLALDVGNTAIKAALLSPGECRRLFSVASRPTGDELRRRLLEALRACGESVVGLRCAISSVCPEAEAAVCEFAGSATGCAEPLFLGRDVPLPIPILVREPERVGVDRLLCACGARELVGAPCVVVSAGTAITVDLVDGEGRFAGGAIAPGFSLSLRALHEGTACLPQVTPAAPLQPAGGDTTEAMRSGVYHFCRAGVRALVQAYGRGLKSRGAPPVVVTGGEAPLLEGALAGLDAKHCEELLLRGVAVALALC